MKRTLIMVVIAGVMAALLGTVATLALFTDETGTTTSNIVAGTVDIEGDRDQGDTVPGPMFYTTAEEGETAPGKGNGLLYTDFWAPGDEHHKVLQVLNAGTLDALLKNISATLEADDNGLVDLLDVVVTHELGGPVIASGKLRDFLGVGQNITPILLEVDDMPSLHFYVSMPLEAGNDYKGLTLKVTFSVYAEQADNNS